MYEIILYDTEDGRCPVQELLDSLEPKLLAKTLRTIDLLEMNDPLLREPYSKPLENGIFELHIKQESDITRVLYFFIVGKKDFLLHLAHFDCIVGSDKRLHSFRHSTHKVVFTKNLSVER